MADTSTMTDEQMNKLIDDMREAAEPELDQQPAPPDGGEGGGGGGDRDLTLMVYLDARKPRVMVFPRTDSWQFDCECVEADGAHQPPVLRIHHKNDQGDETISRIIAQRVVAVSEVWT